MLCENDEGDFIVLPKDKFSFSVAICSSKRTPGVDSLLRLKIQETNSPSVTDQAKGVDVSIENLASSFSKERKELSLTIIACEIRFFLIYSTSEPFTVKCKKHLRLVPKSAPKLTKIVTRNAKRC